MYRIIIFLAMLVSHAATAADLYVKPYGNPANPTIIFLHGGPGYNSATFEGTSAQTLADSGFYVIVYDRRGEGRSRDTGALYNFRQSSEDLLRVYDSFNIRTATLLGHSFGGVIGIAFAESHPQKVHALVLIGAPVQIQASFRNIISRVKSIYEQKADSTNLKYVAMLERMDTASMMYSSYSLGHAMQNGFYAPKERSPSARVVFSRYRADTALARLASQMDYKATKGFYDHEHYTTLDLRKRVAALRAKGVRLYGLYGKEDALYSPAQVQELGRQLGTGKLLYLDNCSHNVFIDCQPEMIAALREWTK